MTKQINNQEWKWKSLDKVSTFGYHITFERKISWYTLANPRLRILTEILWLKKSMK